MNTSAQSLIHLDGVTKVFFTDEVETHALAGIHLEIKSGLKAGDQVVLSDMSQFDAFDRVQLKG